MNFNSLELQAIDSTTPQGRETPPTPRLKQIWAVGGGKGGVGKSFLSSSLAIALSRLGYKVAAIDLDLGGANLHTTLGIDLPKQSMSDYFTQRVSSLSGCLSPTSIANLQLISGAHDPVGSADLSEHHRLQLIAEIRSLPVDYVVCDLGAGTNYNTLDFFLNADVGLVTLLPEPTSIENAYRFIKSVYYRRLHQSSRLTMIKPLVEAAMDMRNKLGIRTPADLFQKVFETSPETAKILKSEIDSFRPKLIVNQTRTQTDVNVGYSIKSVCKKYFGIDMDYIGFLDYDSAVWQAVRKKRPVMVEFPNSRLVAHLERIAHELVKKSDENYEIIQRRHATG